MKAPQPASPSARRPALGDMLWMACFGAVIFAMVLALAAAMVPAAELPAAKPAATPGAAPALPQPAVAPVTSPALVFVIDAGSRLYPDWKEEHRVHIGERFGLGDTANEAFVESLYPHFMIVDGKPTSVSDSLLNPAVRVLVRRDGAVVDSTWAFLNFPPHFSPKSFFTFQLKDIQGWTGPRGAGLQAAAAANTASHGGATAASASATIPPAPAKTKTSQARKPE